MLQISASAVVSAPPADVLELPWGGPVLQWVKGTDAVTRTEGLGVPGLGLMRGRVDRGSRCTVEAFVQLATREPGEQARA